MNPPRSGVNPDPKPNKLCCITGDYPEQRAAPRGRGNQHATRRQFRIDARPYCRLNIFKDGVGVCPNPNLSIYRYLYMHIVIHVYRVNPIYTYIPAYMHMRMNLHTYYDFNMALMCRHILLANSMLRSDNFEAMLGTVAGLKHIYTTYVYMHTCIHKYVYEFTFILRFLHFFYV